MYVKVFDSILTSSIWSEDAHTRIVWLTLLTLANEDGFARTVPSALARIANVPQDLTDQALAKFLAPDPDDSSHQYDGRRICHMPGGYFIYQYAKYREWQNAEQRRATWRKAAKKYRLKLKTERQQPTVNKRLRKSTEAVAEAEAIKNPARARDRKPQPQRPPAKPEKLTALVDAHWRDQFKANGVRAPRAAD